MESITMYELNTKGFYGANISRYGKDIDYFVVKAADEFDAANKILLEARKQYNFTTSNVYLID